MIALEETSPEIKAIKLGFDTESRVIMVTNMPNLYLDYAPQLAEGIKNGANDLKVYLEDKVDQYRRRQPPEPVPQGILDRMKYLGWKVK
jgi:hypothetical protein